ncbi:MAG: TatD family hydrolase [Muribaculaceae bacterium]|nr:TatD family hydrolase [Muribaculaceae bacterium]
MLVDSHTHLYLEDFAPDNTAAVERAFEAGIGRLMFPNVDISTIEPMKQLASQYTDSIDMSIGLHPTEVKENWKSALKIVENELATGCYKGVGEVGIDLYWDKTFKKQQLKAFENQCDMAVRYNIPLIIHCREGLEEILEVLSGFNGQMPQGVFHSFGGTVQDIERIRALGDFYFGINGIVTFKNSKLKDVLPDIGIDRILLETDSPYLAPVPMRGRRNESAFLIHTAQYVAKALDIPPAEVEKSTTSNYFKLFHVINT